MTARFAAWALALCAACAPEAAPDEALGRARDFLRAARSQDGAWRSQTYGALRGGLSLTPPALKALLLEPGAKHTDPELALSLAYLAGVIDVEGRVDAPLPYPVYTASMAVLLLTRTQDPGWLPARDRWLELLRAQQLDAELGWSEDDLAYGGFGYALRPPRPGEGGPFEADLSSTLFAVGALRLAGVPADAPEVLAARVFVERCQNWPDGDGGFFLSPTRSIQNKAGPDQAPFHSYGTATADGLRALLRCGAIPTEARVRAATRWLAERLDGAHVPGEFDAARESERASLTYYWCWSLAHVASALERAGAPEALGEWRPPLEAALLARQDPDGAWRNPHTLVKENDPLVATPLAIAALELCSLRTERVVSRR